MLNSVTRRPRATLAFLLLLATMFSVLSLSRPVMLAPAVAAVLLAVLTTLLSSRHERELRTRSEMVRVCAPFELAELVVLEMVFGLDEKEARELAIRDPRALRARASLSPFAVAERLEISALHGLELHSSVMSKLEI